MRLIRSGEALPRFALLVAAVLLLGAPASFAQRTCSSCTLPAGSYTAPVIFNAPTQSNLDAAPMQATTQGTITVPASQTQSAGGAALFIKASGTAGNSEGQNGGNGQGPMVANSGAVSVSDPGSPLTLSNGLFGLYSALNGGHGADSTRKQDTAGSGGSTGGMPASNSSSQTAARSAHPTP